MHFYWIGSDHRRDTLQVRLDQPVPDLAAVLRGEVAVTEPLLFRRVGGSRPSDLISTTYSALFLLSERVIDALSAHSFTGWRSLPVVIHDGRAELGGYHGLAITGRSGPFDDSRSQRTILRPPRGGTAMAGLRGVTFDTDTWDGSDIFMPDGSTATLVVDAVRKALVRIKATNIRFDDIAKVEQLL